MRRNLCKCFRTLMTDRAFFRRPRIPDHKTAYLAFPSLHECKLLMMADGAFFRGLCGFHLVPADFAFPFCSILLHKCCTFFLQNPMGFRPARTSGFLNLLPLVFFAISLPGFSQRRTSASMIMHAGTLVPYACKLLSCTSFTNEKGKTRRAVCFQTKSCGFPVHNVSAVSAPFSIFFRYTPLQKRRENETSHQSSDLDDYRNRQE